MSREEELTPRAREVVEYLRERPDRYVSQDEMAAALGSSFRGIGGVCTRLLGAGLVVPRWSGDTGAWEWKAQAS